MSQPDPDSTPEAMTGSPPPSPNPMPDPQSDSSSGSDAEPQPSPSPQKAPADPAVIPPEPEVEPPKDPSKAINYKKVALKVVLDSLAAAKQTVGADTDETGAAPKSETLTEGLGGSGEDSVWQSPLADTAHETVAEIISSITGKFVFTDDQVDQEWFPEPTYVDATDSRATWGGR